MSSGQWKLRMLERGATPGNWFMATVAILCPSLRYVIGISGPTERLLVTGSALDWSTGKISYWSTRMALETGYRRMRAD